ncbi:MAG TPA: MmgE/PrpD family protein [bacterium]
MTVVEQLAEFVARASYTDLSDDARRQLRVRVLDSLGCAIGALGGEPMAMLRTHIDEFGGSPLCTLIGGGRTAPDRAAFYNSGLVRYLDFNDSYLAPGETCHPSDNLGAILAGAEYAGLSGRELLTSLAVAYQVQCRLSDAAPVRAKGFDHTTLGSYAVAAGVAKALGLDVSGIANAVAIAGTAFNALRVTRTGTLSHWKGLAYPNTAFGGTHAAFLAKRGITGPAEVFEGNKGFIDAIAGNFHIDWAREDLERVKRTILKKYNAEIHSQATLEGVLELRTEHHIRPGDVERVEVATFAVAFHIIGGGEEGPKTEIRTKEEADHSLPYMVAVALLDGQVMPAQYVPDRIRRDDVQRLLRRVAIREDPDYSKRFPAEMPCRIEITLRDGRRLVKERTDYEGFYTRPMAWETVIEKFNRLSASAANEELRGAIVDTVSRLDEAQMTELVSLLARVGRESTT